MVNLDNITRRFILNEGEGPSLQSYIQSLGEALENIRPGTRRDNRRLEVAKSQLKEVKRHSRRLQERVSTLEEQVKVLEEQKGD
tara:strand:+ start:1355 stop:1606 length:252 start_codon:yes stop_codon:yes gene_type:complete